MHGYTPRGKVERQQAWGSCGLESRIFLLRTRKSLYQGTPTNFVRGEFCQKPRNGTGAWEKSIVYKRLYFSAHSPLGHMVLRNLQTCSSLDFGTAAKDYKAGNRPNPKAHTCATHMKTVCKCTGAPQQDRVSVTQCLHAATHRSRDYHPSPGAKEETPKSTHQWSHT